MRPAPSPPVAATRARKIVAALIVALFAGAICWFVEWRSAAPPPPRPVSQVP